MKGNSDLDRFWDTAAGALLWCFVFSVAVLLCWFALIALCGGWVYEWHSKFSDITREQFNLAHYAGMGLMKLGAFTLFLFPFIGIKLARRKRGH
jgi:Family of unknown function (DUF6868)